MFYYKRKLWAMLNSICGREFYVREGRDFIRFEGLRELGDELYEELEGAPCRHNSKICVEVCSLDRDGAEIQ